MNISHLLLIDDDHEDQEIFHAALAEISATIQYSYIDNAKDALEALRAGEIRPDLILLDMNMPKMTGSEFLDQIKNESELSNLSIIIFTTSSDPNSHQAMLNNGASVLLPNREIFTSWSIYKTSTSLTNHPWKLPIKEKCSG